MSIIPQPFQKPIYKKIWFWLIIVLFLIVGIIGVSVSISMKAMRLKSYGYLQEKVKVEKRTVKKTISATGQIEPDEVTNLTFSASGTIKDVKYKTGDKVKKGDLLVTLDPGIPLSDEAKKIKAPFDGRIIKLLSFTGDVVAPGEPVIEFGYNSTHIAFYASDAERIDLKAGQKAVYSIPSYNNGKDEFKGEVIFVGLKKESTFATQATGGENGYKIKLNSGSIPGHIAEIIGLSVDVLIDVDQRINVLSAEIGTVQYDDNGQTFIYLVPELDDEFLQSAKTVKDITEILAKKNIEIGFQGDEYVEFTKGLKEGDELLLYVPANATSGSLF